jgi:hypothetical protein
MPKTQDTATPLEKDTLSKTRTRCQRRTNEREERRTDGGDGADEGRPLAKEERASQTRWEGK